MKKILSLLAFALIVFTTTAQVNNTDLKTPNRWIMIPNLALKGDNGLLIINLPAQAAMLFTVARTGEAKTLYTWHGSTTKEIPPGTYDITFWNIKIPAVIVEKRKETRIPAGVLNSTVKKPWEIWTVNGEKVFSAGSAKMVALPAGKYIVKTGGAEIKTTITDGQVSIFSFTSY